MAASNTSQSDESAHREWEQHQVGLRYQEKKDAIVTVTERTPSHDSAASSLAEHWQPGLKARFPWIGALALSTILVCMGLVVLILVTSNGKAQEQWPGYMNYQWINGKWKGRAQLTPSTALALVNTVTNLALIIAIGQGIAIAWWRKALIGSTVEELHKSWEFSSSTLSLATAGRKFNVIALAAIAAKLALVDNVLLQRAAGTGPGTFMRLVDNLRLPVVESLPEKFLGDFDDDNGYLSAAFSQNLRNYFGSTLVIGLDSWGQNPDHTPWDTYCSGTCKTHVEAFGFNVTCSPQTTKDFSFTTENARANVFNANKTNSTNDEDDRTLLRLFAYAVGAFEESDYRNTTLAYPEPWVSLVVNYANSYPNHSPDGEIQPDTCSSTFYSSRCALRPAVVRYSIAITNYTSSNSQGANGINITDTDFIPLHDFMKDDRGALQDGQTWAQKVVRPLYYDEEDHDRHYPNMGAVAQILKTTFAANVTRQYLNDTGYVATPGAGSMSQWYVYGPVNETAPRSCEVSVKDPLVWLVDQINNLMLRASISAALDSDQYPSIIASGLHGDLTIDTVRFDSDYAFMVAALAIMLLCILAVMPAYYGFWQLGRKVTLGPMEIASAFRAPVLDHPKVAAAGEVDVLLKEVGGRQVRYGEVEGTGTLGVAEPEAVRKLNTTPR